MHTSPEGKSYIGRTKNYTQRCRDHKNQKRKSKFSKAVKSIGWDNFKHEILKDGLTLEEANHWEEFYIKYFNTFEPNGYNSQGSEVSKKRISDSKKGLTSPRKGMKLSDASKAKIGNANRGRIKSQETCLKIAKANTGKKHTEEHKQYISKVLKGRKYSAETIQKMREAAFKRVRTKELPT